MKRPWRARALCASLLAASSCQAYTATAFQSSAPRPTVSNQLVEKPVLTIRSPRGGVTLPPWLARFDGDSSSWSQVRADWQQLDLPLPPEALRRLYRALTTLSPAQARACLAFVQTYQSVIDDKLSEAMVWACMEHFVECIGLSWQAVVQESILPPVPELLGSTAENEDDNVFLLETTIAIGDQEYPVTDMQLYKDMEQEDIRPEIERIKAAALRIKRTEMLAQVLLVSGEWTSNSQAAQHIQSMLLSVTDEVQALALRCTACLFRLEGAIDAQRGVHEYQAKSPEVIRAAKEGLHVYSSLAERLGMPQLKSRMEDAAFRILYRRQYAAAASVYSDAGHLMNALTKSLQQRVQDSLESDLQLQEKVESLRVFARTKEPFSLWKKLLRSRTPGKAMSLRQVNDAVALRVVVRARCDDAPEDKEQRDQLLCYYIQKKLQDEYGAIRIKDYIRHPKPNGYQSLHHTSIVTTNGIDFPFEVQIRSDDMHYAAEHGTASHWHYKLGGKNDAVIDTAATICDPTVTVKKGSGAQAYHDALVVAKESLLQQQIHVFMTETEGKGQLLTLPLDASVYDALSSSRQRLSPTDEEMTVWKNGKIANLDDSIENGDVLLIS